jgi:hypothetical protein
MHWVSSYCLLAEARVGAGDAGLRTRQDLFTAADESLVDVASYVRMLTDDPGTL